MPRLRLGAFLGLFGKSHTHVIRLSHMVYKFYVKLFNSFGGEVLGDFETLPLAIPEEKFKLQRYMDAYINRLKLDPNIEYGMSITSERMLNKRSKVSDRSWIKEGDLF